MPSELRRDSVWAREEVVELVRSIIRDCFIGSLLLRCDPKGPPFAPAGFLRRAQPPYKEPQSEHLVLDGQQRRPGPRPH